MLAQLGEDVGLGSGRRHRQRSIAADRVRQRRTDQIIERPVADDGQHLGLLVRAGADVARREAAGVGGRQSGRVVVGLEGVVVTEPPVLARRGGALPAPPLSSDLRVSPAPVVLARTCPVGEAHQRLLSRVPCPRGPLA